MDGFYALFENYWWLLFPFGVFVFIGFGGLFSHRRAQARIALLKTYAEAGTEPPAELLRAIQEEGGEGTGSAPSSGRGTSSFLVILFLGLAAVFAGAGYTGVFGQEAQIFYFVAAILGVLALAFLVSGIAGRRSN